MYKGKIVFPTKHAQVVRSVVSKIYNQLPKENTAGYSEAIIEVTKRQLELLDPYWGEWIWSLEETR